jgi:hypothetical protein
MSTTTKGAHKPMPPKPTNRTPEPAVGIRAELGAYGLWLEIEHTPGDWHAVFLPTRTVRRLVTALLADRQQTLAAIDPLPRPPSRRPPKRREAG